MRRGIPITVISILWTTLVLMSANAKAELITMDVDSSNGGGTWICESVHSCYIKVQYMEARGADQYCNSVSIKRNGRIIWSKKYHSY